MRHCSKRVRSSSLTLLLAVTAALGFQGCGGGMGAGNASSGSVNIFAYVGCQTPGVSGYSVDSGGSLVPLSGSPFPAGSIPSFITADPLGRLLYGSDGFGTIDGFTINAKSGAISNTDTTFVADGTGQSESLAVHSSGNWLYAASPNFPEIQVFSINPQNAGTTLVTGSPFQEVGGTNPTGLALDPAGHFLFVANKTSQNIAVFGVNQSGGQLTEVGAPASSGSRPFFLTTGASGKYLYVLSDLDSKIYGYNIGATGALTALLPSSYVAPATLFFAAVSPEGNFLYVVSASPTNEVSVYSIAANTGALTEISGSPFLGGSQITSIALTPSGQFAYVVDQNDGKILEYSVNSGTGALTSIGSPVTTCGLPTTIAVAETHP